MKLTNAIGLMLVWTSFGWSQGDDVEKLNRIVNEQSKQIVELQGRLARIEEMLGNTGTFAQSRTDTPARLVQISQVTTAAIAPSVGAPAAVQQPPATPPAGFRFSGDFRLRFDASIRSASAAAPGLQNTRQRYRLRFNADRDVASQLTFHMQLATGAVNNGLTFDQDFAGGVTRNPFFVSEAFVDYHPTPNVSVRGGRLEEVYADNSRFLLDDDVRFHGFNEHWKKGPVEVRAGQYFLVHPNTFSVSASSPLTLAGLTPGKIARSSQMYHQGISADLPGTSQWKQQAIADIQIYRNPNLIALTSNATGVGVTVAPAIGLTPSGPAPGLGNATTSATNAILFAPHYQVARASYRLDASSLAGKARLPLTWMVQVARNVGTSQLRDAVLTSLSVGRTQEKGEMRGLYAFSIKDANSMISQFTDDDLGTGLGTNIATHHFRFDTALRRGIVVQNLLFLQTERRSSNPAAGFFVPLGRETPRTWRYQGQLAITF